MRLFHLYFEKIIAYAFPVKNVSIHFQRVQSIVLIPMSPLKAFINTIDIPLTWTHSIFRHKSNNFERVMLPNCMLLHGKFKFKLIASQQTVINGIF